MSSKKDFVRDLPNFGLLLYAILPICKIKEWLYFPLLLGCIIIFIVVCMYLSKMPKMQILDFLAGTARTNFFMTIIALVGIIISLVLNDQSIYFWCIVFIIGLIEYIWPKH